jgi:hypothetical protein
MDINRNQYFLAGLVLLLLGIQFRLIDSVSLTPQCANFLSSRANHMAIAGSAPGVVENAEATAGSRQVRLPESLGWALLSLGSVLILHSLAMKRPD